ncbi:MAG: rod-binding protein [Candidatus Sericytochromatia bacterium]|nr:rod-binding protein [Candidatus Sericytochromatia bacterium]
MIDNVPLVGSVATGFGSAAVSAPTARTPNVEEASKDFVAMLYSYMFQQMRESASSEEEGLFSGPHLNMLMGFMDQEIGKKLAYGEGKGLADTLLSQLGGEPSAKPAQQAAEAEDARVETLTEAGNAIREMTQKNPEMIDNSEQIMDQLYRLNRQE